jgi:hypothetical protein
MCDGSGLWLSGDVFPSRKVAVFVCCWSDLFSRTYYSMSCACLDREKDGFWVVPRTYLFLYSYCWPILAATTHDAQDTQEEVDEIQVEGQCAKDTKTLYGSSIVGIDTLRPTLDFLGIIGG